MQTEKQRERLVELLNEATFGVNTQTLADHLKKETIVRVAEYLMANGVIVPPCLEEQDIYIIKKNKIVMSFARTFKYHGKDIGLEVEASHWKRDREGWLSLETDIIHETEFGKTVFLSRAEAENVLKERK